MRGPSLWRRHSAVLAAAVAAIALAACSSSASSNNNSGSGNTISVRWMMGAKVVGQPEGMAQKLVVWLKDMESLIHLGMEQGGFERQNVKAAAYSVRGLIESAVRYSNLSSGETADYVARFAVKGLLAAGLDIDRVLAP